MKNTVTFTEQQFQLLKSAFPVQTITPDLKLEEIMFEAGKQRVVEYVSRFVRKGPQE